MHWPPKSPTSRMHWMSCVQTNPITQLHRAQVTNFKHRPIANNKQTPHARHFCTGFHWFGKEGRPWPVQGENADNAWANAVMGQTQQCQQQKHTSLTTSYRYVFIIVHPFVKSACDDCDIRNVPFLGHTSRKQEGVPSTLPRQTSNLHHWRWRSRLHTSIGLSDGFVPHETHHWKSSMWYLTLPGHN